MSFTVPKELKLEGQKFILNSNNNSVVLEITQPFMSAGKKLGWDYTLFGVVGLGVNRSIIRFILTRKSQLVITVLSDNKKYWIRHDQIRHFIRFNRSNYSVSGKTLNILPWKLFSSHPVLEASV